jgi:ribonuclease HI
MYNLFPDIHPATHYTHQTVRDPKPDKPYTKISFQIIDHILATTQTGVLAYHIDTSWVINPLHVSHDKYKNDISDHIPVTIEVDPIVVLGAPLGHETLRSNIPRKVLRIPTSNNAPQWDKLQDHLRTVQMALDSESYNEIRNSPHNPAQVKTLHELASQLQHMIGTHISGPFVKPAKKRPWVSQHTLDMRRTLTARNNFLKQMDMMASFNTNLLPMKINIYKRLTRVCQDGIPQHQVSPPPFAHIRGTVLPTDAVFQDWRAQFVTDTAMHREAYLANFANDKRQSRHQYQQRYDKEGQMKSRQFRRMIFPKDLSNSVFTLVTEDGRSFDFDSDGIDEAHLQYFRELGTPLECPNGPPDLNKFLDDQDLSADPAKARVHRRSREVYAPVTREDIREYLQGKKSTAPGRDGISYDILKIICPAGDNKIDLDINEGLLHCVETAICGLVNTMITKQVFPQSLLSGEIVCLYKSGDPSQLNSYRGITLLSCLYKVVVGIVNKRMYRILEEELALSFHQAGTRANMSCLSKIAVLENIKKHALRNKRALHIFSSDIHKAFDTVHFDTFVTATRAIGFDSAVARLISNLQENFYCSVRKITGGRTTNTTRIDVGCKQGCPLSPLRFILVFDMFLKWLQKRKWGYKWTLTNMRAAAGTPAEGTDALCIPASAFCDDLIMFADSEDELQRMVQALDDFMVNCGMRLSPHKCAFTGIDFSRKSQNRCAGMGASPIPVTDRKNHTQYVHWQHPQVPFRYLGYIWSLWHHDKQYTTKEWRPHVDKLMDSFRRRATAFLNSALQPQDVVAMINSDLMSTLPYGLAAVNLSRKDLLEIQQLVWGVIHKKTCSMLNLPRAAMFAPVAENGMGITHPQALSLTASTDMLLLCLQTPDYYCRITTLDTVYAAQQLHNVNPLRPEALLKPKAGIPTYITQASVNLYNTKLSIAHNPHLYSIKDTPLLENLQPFIPTQHRKSIARLIRINGLWTVSDLLPGMCEPTPQPDVPGDLEIGLTSNLPTDRFIADIFCDLAPRMRQLNYRGSRNKALEFEVLSQAICQMFTKWKSSDTKNLPFMTTSRRADGPVTVHAPPSVVADDHTWRNFTSIGSDGSFTPDPDVGGVGLSTALHNFAGQFPGRQSIDRAEAFGAMACCLLATSPCTVYTDSRSTLTSIQDVNSNRFQPTAYKSMANFSIIKHTGAAIQRAEAAGVPIRVEWVKSHTDPQEYNEPKYELNRRADQYANIGRTSRSKEARASILTRGTFLIDFDECYEHLPKSFLKDRDCIIESKTHAHILRSSTGALHSQTLSKVASSSTGTRNLLNLTSDKQWHEASTNPILTQRKHARLHIFKVNMACDSLRAPYMIFKTNVRKFPRLDGSITSCEICGMQCKPDAYHYICRCPGSERCIDLVRHQEATQFQQHLLSKIHCSPPLHFLFRWLFPPDKTNYTFGLTPLAFRTWAHLQGLDPTQLNVLRSSLQLWITQLYHSVWKAANKDLHQRGVTLRHKLKRAYNLRPRDMAEYAPPGDNQTPHNDYTSFSTTSSEPSAIPTLQSGEI